MPVALTYHNSFNRSQLAAGVRAGLGTVGYRGSDGELAVLNPGGSPPAGTAWDGNALIVSGNNVTLDHYRINGEVFCTGSNPTVTHCRVVTGSGSLYGITLSGAGKGVLTVQDTTVTRSPAATAGNVQVNAISSDSGLVARRCDVSGTGDGIHVVASPSGSLVSQCCVHDLAFVDEAQHLDGIQVFNDPSSVSAFTVEHCHIASVVSGQGTAMNSGLTCGPPTNNSEPLCTPTVSDNYFASGLYHLRVNFRLQDAVITDNDFGPLAGNEFGLVSWEGATLVAWSNNRDSAGNLIPSP